MLLKERGGSGHVRGAPLDYLSWPRFGGLVASYVFSILSIVRLPSRIMYFSAPPFACVFAMYVPFHTGLFVGFVTYNYDGWSLRGTVCVSLRASVGRTAVRFFREGAEPLRREQLPTAMGHPPWGSNMGFM